MTELDEPDSRPTASRSVEQWDRQSSKKSRRPTWPKGPGRPLRAGDFLSIRPDHVMTHDNTSAVMKKFKAIGAKKIHDPAPAGLHRRPRHPEHGGVEPRQVPQHGGIRRASMASTSIRRARASATRSWWSSGYVLPGNFVVASDSHSNMYGALGAVGTPVVRTDAAAIWATGEFWWQIPRTIQVVLEGKLAPGVTGKDVIITLCGLYNQEEVLNAAVEFTGPGVASLSMDARLSIANMTTEWGALVGWFPVDDVTLVLHRRRGSRARARKALTRISEQCIQADSRQSAGARPRRCLRRPHRARPRRGHAARLRARHRPGHAVGRRDREAAGRDPQGLSGFVRELAPGGPGRRRQSSRRQESRAQA